MIFSRRGILAGLTSLLAAPAIVRAGVLMPVRTIIMLPLPAAPSPAMRYMVEMMSMDSPTPLLDMMLQVTNMTDLEVKTVRFGDWYPDGIYPAWPQWVDCR